MLTYALTLTAAAETLKADVGALDGTFVGVVFAATSMLTIAAPVIVVLAAPERSGRVLMASRDRVVAHSRTITLIALMVIGALLIARGAYDLAR